MPQIEPAGFEDLRAYAEGNWTHVALLDNNGNEITRIDIPNDGRASVASGSSSNPLTYQLDVQGSDSDITTPVTISEAEVYKTSGSSTVLGEQTFSDATLNADADQLTVTVDIEIPPV